MIIIFMICCNMAQFNSFIIEYMIWNRCNTECRQTAGWLLIKLNYVNTFISSMRVNTPTSTYSYQEASNDTDRSQLWYMNREKPILCWGFIVVDFFLQLLFITEFELVVYLYCIHMWLSKLKWMLIYFYEFLQVTDHERGFADLFWTGFSLFIAYL